MRRRVLIGTAFVAAAAALVVMVNRTAIRVDTPGNAEVVAVVERIDGQARRASGDASTGRTLALERRRAHG